MQASDNIYLRALRPEDLIHLDQISEATAYEFARSVPPEDLVRPPASALDPSAGSVRLIGFAIMAGPELVGQITLTGIDHARGLCSVTMGIARREQRSRGSGTQALQMVLRYAFNSLGLQTVTTETLSSNRAAIRVLEKVGFRLTGTEKRVLPDGTGFVDRLHFSIIPTWQRP